MFNTSFMQMTLYNAYEVFSNNVVNLISSEIIIYDVLTV